MHMWCQAIVNLAQTLFYYILPLLNYTSTIFIHDVTQPGSLFLQGRVTFSTNFLLKK